MPDSFLEPEYAPAFTAWKSDPTPENGSAVLQSVRPILDTAIKTYGGVQSGPSVKSHAKSLTLDALGRYDPATAPLKPYLMQQLKGLYRTAATETAPIHIPERIRIDYKTISDAHKDLYDDLGRDPSDAELADYTSIPVRRIAKIRSASAPAVGQRFADESGDEVEPAVKSNTRVWESFVYNTLGPVDQLIMEYTLGLRGRTALSNQEIARKLRVTPGAVSQRKARIQSLLDRPSAVAG